MKDKGGRPTKLTTDVVNKLEEILKIDGTVSEACNYAGISRTMYYEHLEKDKDFSDRMSRAKDYPFILARKMLIKGINEGDNKLVMEYMKRRDKRYSEKQEIESKQEINIKNLENLPTEELLEYLKK